MDKTMHANPINATMNTYLLGTKNKLTYWLEEPVWQDNMWKFGNIIAYEPDDSLQTILNTTFATLFLKNNPELKKEVFSEYFDETPFTDDEIKKLIHHMSTYNAMKTNLDTAILLGNKTPENYDETINVLMPNVFKDIRELLYTVD